MLAKVQKWGNSLALRLPKSVANQADLHINSPVEIIVRDQEIIIQPVRKKKSYELDDLLAQVKPDNIHQEADFGKPMGKEVW